MIGSSIDLLINLIIKNINKKSTLHGKTNTVFVSLKI
jgi:hypothetical protein